jgi:hypothetical protein
MIQQKNRVFFSATWQPGRPDHRCWQAVVLGTWNTQTAACRLTATVRAPRRIWHGKHCLQIAKSVTVQ